MKLIEYALIHDDIEHGLQRGNFIDQLRWQMRDRSKRHWLKIVGRINMQNEFLANLKWKQAGE